MYIVYDGRSSKTRQAAGQILAAAADRGLSATQSDIAEVRGDDIASADVLVVGCTARVDTPFGGRTREEARTWVESLPDLDGKPVGVFCTYSFFPHTFADVTTRTAEVLSGLEQALEMKGGKVIASQAILNRKIPQGAELLVDRLSTKLGL